MDDDERAAPLLRAMRASLTMRRDRTAEAVRRLDWGELKTLGAAIELLGEETAQEIVQRTGRL